MTDFRALCSELVAALAPDVVARDGYGPVAALLPKARAALAEPEEGNPYTEILDYYAALAAQHSQAVYHAPNQ